MAFVLPAHEAATPFQEPGSPHWLVAQTLPLDVWAGDPAPARAWIGDPESRYSYVNRHYERAFGVRAAEVTGKDPALFYPPEVAAKFIESDRKVQREGVPLQFIDSQPAPGRWLKVKFPLPDARGGIAVAGIAIDISAQMRLEEALQLSEQRFRAFMDHTPTMAWIKDSRLRYTYVNRCYEETFGRKLSEVIGCDVFAFHPRETAERFRATDLQIQREQLPLQMITGTKRADGSEGRWLHVKFPLADASGAIGVGGIGVDITDRSRLEEAFRES